MNAFKFFSKKYYGDLDSEGNSPETREPIGNEPILNYVPPNPEGYNSIPAAGLRGQQISDAGGVPMFTNVGQDIANPNVNPAEVVQLTNSAMSNGGVPQKPDEDAIALANQIASFQKHIIDSMWGGNDLRTSSSASPMQQAQAREDMQVFTKMFSDELSGGKGALIKVLMPDGTISYQPRNKAIGQQAPKLGASTIPEADIKAIGDQMISGKIPPVISNAYRKIAPELQAYLAKNNFDQTAAEADWTATKKHLSSMNSTQQLRLGQAIEFTKESLPIIEDLASQWKAGGFAPLSYAALKAAEQGALGTKAQSMATRLNAQINDLTSELGTVYKGGNSSTDESLKLAAANLKGQWEESVLMDNINQIRKNLTLRENSMRNSGIAGLSNDSLYRRLNKPKQETVTLTPITQYIAENVTKYSQKQLYDQMIKAGWKDDEIIAAWRKSRGK